MTAEDLQKLLESNFAPDFNLLGLRLGELLSLPATLLTLAVIAEMLLPISSIWNLSRLKNTFEELSKKVNLPNRKLTHRYFAGFMLILLISLIFIFLVSVSKVISGSDSIISFIILIFLLRQNPTQVLIGRLKNALDNNELKEAKIILAPQVLRETKKLSYMGLCKAGCESAILRLFSSWFAIMVWFFILGDIGALIMALSSVFCEAFNMKLEKYSSFGLFASRLEQTLLIPPAFIFALLNFLTPHPVVALKEGLRAAKEYPAPISGFILGLIGSSLKISLGGPRYYEGNLIRFPKVGDKTNPNSASLIKVLRRMRYFGVLLLGFGIAFNLYIAENLPKIEEYSLPKIVTEENLLPKDEITPQDKSPKDKGLSNLEGLI